MTDISIMPTVVWTEIPVTDLATACDFYRAVFGWNIEVKEMEPNPVANFSGDDQGIHGHLYPGAPARDGSGPTLHLLIPDHLEAAAERCVAAGGKIVSPAIEIPPGKFMYAQDPDGNSLGLFQAKDR